MPRISKAPEERRLEFIEAAERLFFDRGFDETTVNDIVKELNVAQGTFYCYFKSKDDVLAVVILRNITSVAEKLRKVIDEPFRDAGERLSRLITTILLDYSERTKLAAYMQKESNASIHQRSVKEVIAIITPMLEEVIREGKQSGVFKVEHPTEMAAVLIGILMHIFHDLGLVEEPKRRQRMRVTLTQIITRSLCAKEGSIKLKW
jgi:AcrR family transcriptional regulator